MSRWRKAATHLCLVVGAALFILPFLWLVSTSLKPIEQTMQIPPQWLPRAHYAPVHGKLLRVIKLGKIDEPSAIFTVLEGPRKGEPVLVTKEDERKGDDQVLLEVQRVDVVGKEWTRAKLVKEVPAGWWHVREKFERKYGDRPPLWDCVPAEKIQEKIEFSWSNYKQAVLFGSIPRNMVKNGSFEQDDDGDNRPDGWEGVDRAPAGAPAHGGLNAALPSESCSQVVSNIEGGKPYRLTGWATAAAGITIGPEEEIPWGKVVFRSTRAAGTRELGELVFSSRESTEGDWVGVGQKFTTPPGCDSIALHLCGDSRVWLDDVVLTPIEPILFFTYLRNTLIVCVLGVIGVVLSSSLVAYGFSRIRWPGRDVLFIMTLATMMIPFPVTMIPLYGVFRKLHWIGSLKPLWVPAFFGSAFSIFLLRQFFLTIPEELSDAARIDGCSELGIYWRIILPLSKPALAVVALFHFLYAWNDFLGPLIYLTKQSSFTLSLGLQFYQSQHGGSEWHLLMAAATIIILPIIVLFFFTQKFFIRGITMTGIKG